MRNGRILRSRTGLVALSLVLAVTVAVFWGGGFGASAQSVFVALAGAALVAATIADGAAASAAFRAPLVVTLIGLAAMSVLSASWTIASPTGAVRAGLVIGGYAAVFIAGRSVGCSLGPLAIAIGIAVLAGANALLGLGGVALHALPDAERIGRTWRPGGTFEYQPALALLQVAAVPALAHSIERPGLWAPGVAAAGAFLAGSVLMLANSRLALALAALVLLGLSLKWDSLQGTRSGAITVTLLAVVGALVAPRLLGAAVGPHAPAAGVSGLAGLLAVALASAIAFPLARMAWRRQAHAVMTAGLGGALIIVGVIVAVGAYAPDHRGTHADPALGRAGRPSSDLLHGRAQEWIAAIDTWRDRPLLGAGAGTYAVASFPHQKVARSLFAHDLPLELAAELGIIGFLLAIGLYAASGCIAWRAAPTVDGWLLAPFVVAFLISNLVDWTWHLTGLTAMWAAAAGALSSRTSGSD